MKLVYRKPLTHNIAMVYCMQNSNFFSETESPEFVDWPNLFLCLKSNPPKEKKKGKEHLKSYSHLSWAVQVAICLVEKHESFCWHLPFFFPK